MKCAVCGKEEVLPFVCNYCGGTYCADHRLPESHRCTGDLSRPAVVAPAQTYSWQGSTYSVTGGRKTTVFSTIEIRDILIAWVALSAAFVITTRGNLLIYLLPGGGTLTQIFVAALIAVGSGFILHELAHKFSAERYGFWAEFRLWPVGLLLALLTSVIGFLFAAPGATYIQGSGISEKENGVISLWGPITNVLVSAFFLLLLLLASLLGHAYLYAIAGIGFQINIILATFNMLPIFPLDGSKVFRWNKPVWIGVFVPLVVVTALFYLGLIF